VTRRAPSSRDRFAAWATKSVIKEGKRNHVAPAAGPNCVPIPALARASGGGLDVDGGKKKGN